MNGCQLLLYESIVLNGVEPVHSKQGHYNHTVLDLLLLLFIGLGLTTPLNNGFDIAATAHYKHKN